MHHQEVVTLRFKPKLSDAQKARIYAEYNDLIEGIAKAMDKAGLHTTNSLSHAIFRMIRDNAREYIRLEVENTKCRFILASDRLRAFDVRLPVNGVQTTATHLAKKIGSEFVPEYNPKVTIKREVMP